jgi:hypothetical protein
MIFEEGKYFFIQYICGGDRYLDSVQFPEGHPCVGIDGRLLVDPAHSSDVADVKRILCNQVARVVSLAFVVEFFSSANALENGAPR